MQTLQEVRLPAATEFIAEYLDVKHVSTLEPKPLVETAPAEEVTYADMIVEYLACIGIEVVFGVPGGAIEPFLNALAKSERKGGPRLVVARHECGAAFMADGYYRETGKMGVVCATTGPGATNLITGVSSALADKIPMLVITAQTPLPKFGKNALQESSCTAIDIVGMFKYSTQFNTLVSHPEQLENKLIAAIMAAHRVPHGPAHISIPTDVLRTPATIKPHIHADLLVQDFPVVDSAAIDVLCQKLAKVDTIAVYVGGGVGKACHKVMRFIELTGAGFVTGPTGKGWVDETHPQFHGVFGFAGHNSARALFQNDNVDLIIAIGTELEELGTSGWTDDLLNTKLVHIDSIVEHFTRSPMANLHVLGDIASIFDRLIEDVKAAIIRCHVAAKASPLCGINHKIDPDYFENLKEISPNYSLYELWLMVTQNNYPESITKVEKEKLLAFKKDISKLKKYQHKETIYRYQEINKILKKTYIVDKNKATDLRSKLDKIFTHKIFGYVLFFLILLVIFQSIFDLASIPMDFIDATFAEFSNITKNNLAPGVFTDLLSEGIIPGIGGVIIFIPQIAILFLFIAVLEETGYMSRVVFLMDKIMRRFGMNGKSVIPLISGTACAIPAIMATRTISSWKERLITILVTPFTTCSARLPVYAILIALVIPDTKVFGFLNLQGLVLLLLYALGFASAILAAFILHKTLKIKTKSFFVIEMPNYKVPSIKNVFYEVVEKTKAFVFGAGKIILALSIVLWFLASNGGENFRNAENIVVDNIENQHLNDDEIHQKVASLKLENSYIGVLGKTIEPVIKPLGYDWKIGIAVLTSFAAREVFVGTLATIYSVGSGEDNTETITHRMAAEINPETKRPLFNLASGISLLLFYAFAMQCMSTLAVVKRETNSWKWPAGQLIFMSLFAYIVALIAYQILK